ncbi:MAG: glycosyltransferase family 4 protein [Solirubrobacterales bacterium]|nr:glycosyltransferase family 4 protein [Solirubrobacterales bacterium]
MIDLAVAGEYTAGHVTFLETLRGVAARRQDLNAQWVLLPFPPEGGWERLPPIRSNWSIRASLRARRALAPLLDGLDAMLIHTQTAALFSTGLMRRVPTVLSVDATPINWDAVGEARGHSRDNRAIEGAKRRVVRRTFNAARAVIAWSDWVRASLERDYGLDPQRVVTIPAGVDLPPATDRSAHRAPVRLLFIGSDFEGKGGADLLAVLNGLSGWELDVVTYSSVPDSDRVRVHRDVLPRSARLAELYSRADAFVFPTRGDASPFALLEGMAAGLPVVSTTIGAIGEMVSEGTGLLVAPGDLAALRRAIERMIADADLRLALGQAARARVVSHYAADRNCNRMLDVLVQVARESSSERS